MTLFTDGQKYSARSLENIEIHVLGMGRGKMGL